MSRTLRIPLFLTACLLLMCNFVLAQSSATAELHVTAKDPKGAAVTNATVTVRDEARNFERVLRQGAEGQYQFLLLPPGVYTVTVEAPGFAKLVTTNVRVTVGQAAELPVALNIAGTASEVTVSGEAEIVETQRTSSATTIDQTRIDNLPINGRNYVNFTLTNSQVARDSAPSIGAAPTSGLNVGGQRARSNLVNVDGADAVDNSTNGIRSTVSQEAVQEFQLVTNGYSAEYGRASGGVVNIITRSGTNNLHGTAFGYLRNRNFQAVNPFSNVPDPAYTRVQAGFNLGGALKKDKTFYFVSYEITRRQETGFSTIGANNFDLTSVNVNPYVDALAGVPVCEGLFAATGGCNVLATPAQAAFFTTPPPLPAAVIGQYALLVGGASGTALDGAMPLWTTAVAGAPNPFQFITSCSHTNTLCNGLPLSFAPLRQEEGNYPVSEGTTIVDARLDHKFNNSNSATLRASVSPSTVTGLQPQGQNQNFGQNAFSRTAIQQFRDFAITAQDTWTIGNNKINEFRFQYARRGLLFNFNDRTPLGAGVASNLIGFAFIGHEPFSFIRRTEERYQFVDNFSISKGTHTFKFGADINHLPVAADFTVNFGGVYSFDELSASNFGFNPVVLGPGNVVKFPGFSPVQSYGLGAPTDFIQGVGNPHAAFNNNPMGFFFQDSWRIKPNLTLNYGVRYDVELIASPPPLNAVSQAGYDYLGLVNGIPQDNNNVAPRIGLAWDPFKDGKTVVRASYGLFYDHPLLGLQFLAQATDAVGTPQVLLGPGAPCSASGSLSPGNGNATNTFQGILQLPTCAGPFAAGFGYDPTQQRFTTNFPNSLWINQNFLNPVGPLPNTPLGFLPFGFPLAKGFQYAYSNQANFSIERDLGKGFALTVGYSFNGGRHLNRPINSNTVNTGFLVSNWERAVAAALAAGLTPNSKNFPSQPFDVGVEDPSFPMYQPCGVAAGGVYVPAPLVNFFRPSGLNPSLTAFGGACTGLAAAVDASLFPGINPATGFPNSAPNGIPFSDMTPNYSNGSSVYHGLTANLRKRFSGHYEFLASYTWAHTIDDSTDLQSPLAPQDSHLPSAERSNSTFDQRHRFVFSGVYQSGKVAGEGFLRKLLSDWTIAPIIEVGSGRPFTVLTGVQANFQFAPNSARPNAVPSGTAANPICNNTPVASAFSPAGFFQVPCFVDADVTAAILTGNPALIDGNFTDSLNGNLGRNTANKPTTVFTDMRVARRIHLTERLALDGMVDMFNFVNKFNVADVNPLYTIAGQPTAAYDPRQFQFALRLSW